MHARKGWSAFVFVVLSAAFCGGGSPSVPPPPPAGGGTPTPASAAMDVLTYHNDVARTGQQLNETALTPSTVNSANFGKVGFIATIGLVDAEPLFAAALSINGATHNAVFAVTEHDLVYAFDADTFAQLWQTSVLPSGGTTSDDHGCGQITPEIGITSTPVVDPAAGPHGAIFVVAMSKDAAGNYYQRLHALDLTTGAELFGGPTTIQATYTGAAPFAPANYAERAGLLLLNGTIYLAFTSHCDQGSYQGWVMAYSESTLQQTAVLNLTPNGSDGSIWMSGAGMAADTAGNIYFLDANGTFDTTLNAAGMPVNGDFGNAFVELSTAGGGLTVADYFAVHNTVTESGNDEDLGSGGALVLPDLTDASGQTHHLAVGAGKDGNIYIVNRDSMGKFNPNTDSAIYQEITANGLSGGVWAMPAYFNHTVYYAAVGDALKAFAITNAQLSAPPASQSAASFAYPGSTPSVSASRSSGGIVWAVENRNGAGVLHAYDAANLARELYNSTQAGTRDAFADNKFITPMIAKGKVYIGTPTGVVVFGALH